MQLGIASHQRSSDRRPALRFDCLDRRNGQDADGAVSGLKILKIAVMLPIYRHQHTEGLGQSSRTTAVAEAKCSDALGVPSQTLQSSGAVAAWQLKFFFLHRNPTFAFNTLNQP